MKDLLLGFTQQKPSAEAEPVFLAADERHRTHALVVGSPGSGKSKFLEWMIRSDIRDRQGLCVLDIHGTLYHDVKRWCAYNHFLTRDIVLLDPSSGEYIQGFNPFKPKPGVEVDVQVGGMVQALLRVWGAEDTNETPTLDRVLRLVFSAMIVKGIPVHEAFYLVNFSERRLRAEAIASLTEPAVVAAWRQLQELKRAGEWRDEVLSTENRLFRLASSKTIKRFMGSMDELSNLNILEVMNKGKVLLVNLKESAQLTEENAKAFAALLINDLFKTAIMFRDRDTLDRAPLPFYLYLDEWQNFVTPDIKKILAQARKFGLLLVLANQDLAQIREAFSDEFVDTLMTCCQIKTCFGGLNRRDAQRVAQEILVSQIDLNETKYEIESTKFWPRYARDTVYTSSSAGSSSDASQYDEDGNLLGTARAASDTDGESVADIPILIPEPFTEITSRTTYSLEEQLWRWSDRLMEQYQRHCFIKLPGRKTIPMLVPRVKDYFVGNAAVANYEAAIARRINAKRPSEVDALLAGKPYQIAIAAVESADTLPDPSDQGDDPPWQ
jgi:hypothetical protein